MAKRRDSKSRSAKLLDDMGDARQELASATASWFAVVFAPDKTGRAHSPRAGEALGMTSDEANANAGLIAEAGTVATETGLTPRQLADQRADLLAACEDIENEADYDESDGAFDLGERLGRIADTARAALKLAKGE